MPVGRDPPTIVQLYGDLPPVTLRVSLYNIPAVAVGKGDKFVIVRTERNAFVKAFR